MEIKTWEEYNNNEKLELLNHWFIYYGATLITLKEIEDFNKLASTHADDIFDSILTLFLFGRTIQTTLLLNCMHSGKIDELFSHNLTPEKVKEAKAIQISKNGYITSEEYEEIRKLCANEIAKTYINPKPYGIN